MAGIFKEKVIVVTGASRGIGREIALKLAADGAKLVLAAKTVEPHPKLPGTIYSVAKEVESVGGEALPIQVDVRDPEQITTVVEQTIKEFGGIDILINNASAISLTPTLQTTSKKFDLMFGCNVRATFLCSQAALPYLIKSDNPHILNLSPPIKMDSKWFKDHVAYTMSKYGMSMCTLGMAEEFLSEGVAVNSLWPKTTIATAAVQYNFPKDIYEASRKPTIVADAAYLILQRSSKECTGRFFVDEEVLQESGQHNLDSYSINSDVKLFADLFI